MEHKHTPHVFAVVYCIGRNDAARCRSVSRPRIIDSSKRDVVHDIGASPIVFEYRFESKSRVERDARVIFCLSDAILYQ